VEPLQRLLAARELVNGFDLAGAYALVDCEPIPGPPEVASALERLRGCLAIRLGHIPEGFELLERNRVAGVPPATIPLRYRCTVEADPSDRATRGLFECLVTGTNPEAIAGPVVAAGDYARARTIANARWVGWRFAIAKRKDDAAIALASYARWLDAAVDGRAGARKGELLQEVHDILLESFKDRAGAKALQLRLVQFGK
jgi:hypothetical protein